MSSQDRSTISNEARVGERTPAASRSSEDALLVGRVIRPPAGDGVLIDNAPFQLEDVTTLAESLARHAEGKLQRLQRAATEIEAHIRHRVEDSQGRIQRALEKAQQMVQRRINDTAARSREILTRRHEEGLALGKSQGYEEGLAQGLAEGLQQGAEQARAQLAADREQQAQHAEETLQQARAALTEDFLTATAAYEQVVAHFEHYLEQTYIAPRNDMLELIRELAEQVTVHQVESVPEVVRTRLLAALDRMSAAHRLTIEIHPRDREVAEKALLAVQALTRGDGSQGSAAPNGGAGLKDHPQIQWVEREDIGRGGCCVRGEHCTVELTHESQMAILDRRLAELGVETRDASVTVDNSANSVDEITDFSTENGATEESADTPERIDGDGEGGAR